MADQSDTNSVAIVSQHFPPDKSGNASRIHDTARHLENEGWDVTVIAPPPAFPHGQFDRSWRRKQSSVQDGITVHRLWAWQPSGEDPHFLSRMAYYVLFPLHAMLWLIYHSSKFDVIVTSSPPVFTGIAGIPSGYSDEKGWIVDVRDLWIDASVGLGFIKEGGIGERLARRYQRFVLQHADRITVTTTVLGERLVDQYNVDEEKIVHLPNGVDTDRFEPSESEPDPVIVYTGNVGHAQDLESCVRAMKKLDRKDVTLKIVGDGDRRPTLEHLASEIGLDGKVEFTGLVPREEIPDILDDAMIGIAPLKTTDTLEYAVPTKVYEYMAAGLPIVATGVGEIESVVEEGGAGIIASGNPQEISSVFRELLSDESRRGEMGKRAREHVIEKYDRRNVALRLGSEIDDLCSGA